MGVVGLPNYKPALCPFEIEHHGKVIVCEGAGQWERLVHEFEDRAQMVLWRKDFCTFPTYKGCPYYRVVMEATYPEEGEI